MLNILSPFRKKIRSPLVAVIISAAVHVSLLGGAASLTIWVVYARAPAAPPARVASSIAPPKLEHHIRVQQLQAQANRPALMPRIVGPSAPKHVALPAWSQQKQPGSTGETRENSIGVAGNGLAGCSELAGGLGRSFSGTSGYSDAKFFGENVRTRGLCILVDTSRSIVEKGALKDVKDEAAALLRTFSVATKFDLIAFVDGAAPFSSNMVYATAANKEKAMGWLGAIRPNITGNRKGVSGSTPFDALRMAIKLDCDTIFVITDDPPYLKESREHQKEIIEFIASVPENERPKINAILYKPHPNEKGQCAIAFYRKLAQTTGGHVTVLTRAAVD